MDTMTNTRIILADDHKIVRAGLRNALLQLSNLTVVGEVGNGPELFEMLREHPIDLLIIDERCPTSSRFPRCGKSSAVP